MMNIENRRDNGDRAVLTSLSLNAVALSGIGAILLVAFYYQLAFDELPCPLCLLQRAGFILIGIGFAMNLRFGVRGLHYGCVLLSAVATAVIAVRQTLLHISPDAGAYGSALWGLHFYTWSLVVSVLIVLFVALLLIVDRANERARPVSMSIFGRIAIAIFAFTAMANLVSTVLECGGGECASDPVSYELLDRLRNT